jgi:membrane protein DedA with SNARE-associated domain
MLFAKYLGVLLASMFKFVMGPLAAFAVGLNFWEAYLFTVLGMMMSVATFTYLGTFVKNKILARFRKSKKLFNPRNRRVVRIWRSYGLVGVAFLTPLILTPIGGTLIAASFGENKNKIFIYMLISAAVWGVIIVGGIYFLNDVVSGWLGH